MLVCEKGGVIISPCGTEWGIVVSNKEIRQVEVLDQGSRLKLNLQGQNFKLIEK